MDLREAIPVAWLVWAGTWLAAATARHAPGRVEAWSSRLVHLGLLALTFALLFSDTLGVGLLGKRVLSAGPLTSIVALVAVLGGLGFASWGRIQLGRHWSGAVAIHPAHSLMRSGPYSIVRHPMYAGLLLAICGTAMAQGELRGPVAALIGWIAFRRKARLEEHWLSEHFGTDYEDYVRQVPGRLVPRVSAPCAGKLDVR